MALPKKKSPAAATTPSPAPAPVAAAPAPVTAGPVTRSETKGSGTAAKPVAKATPTPPTYDQIAKRAYEIYAGRGYTDGNPQADWLEAERQLRAGL